MIIASVQRVKDTGDLLVAGVQPGNAVKSRLDVIVFILVCNAGHSNLLVAGFQI